MIITGITHADARDKKHPFRGLTGQGREEAISAAGRFRELMGVIETGRGVKIPTVGRIVSSPKARCLETAILFAKAISDFGLMATSEVQVDAGLKAGSISGDELSQLAKRIKTPNLLVSAHADLARALPAQVELTAGSVKEGWFTDRPVLFTIDYEAGEPWEQARILSCEGYFDGSWRDLIQA